MAVVHNRLKGMYIHYELCILRFYEACLGLVGFCLLSLSADHGQRFWVVTIGPGFVSFRPSGLLGNGVWLVWNLGSKGIGLGLGLRRWAWEVVSG